jgi:ankyrin repeat protein
VEYLLAKGAKVNIANNNGQTPLYIAVCNGHEDIVDLLLDKEYNCNVNIREFQHGESPLHIAALVLQYLREFTYVH